MAGVGNISVFSGAAVFGAHAVITNKKSRIEIDLMVFIVFSFLDLQERISFT